MLCINDHHTDAWFNAAAEEHVFRNFGEPCFMLWCNEPAVVIGRHQNTLAEINFDYVKRHDIKVVRRLSGGGAVFHDPGNINFSFIDNKQDNEWIDFPKYIRPVVAALHAAGVDAQPNERNDLTMDGKKISGNAEHASRNRILHHGTLLYRTELSVLSEALSAAPAKFSDKAVKSVRSRVTNISNHLANPPETEVFRSQLFRHVMNGLPGAREYRYSAADLDAIHRLRDEKYATWEWNFGQSPGYSMLHGIPTGAGYLEAHLNVQKGIISHLRFSGDMPDVCNMSGLERLLLHTPHNETAVREKLSSVRFADCFPQITEDEVVNVMF
ncbi:MAG: lipoate--protein ligase [Bacteroidales bacterium]|nr:lipoate--protein ligase [Bacteroidales bacterium]